MEWLEARLHSMIRDACRYNRDMDADELENTLLTALRFTGRYKACFSLN